MAGTCVEESSVESAMMANHKQSARKKVRTLVEVAKKNGRENTSSISSLAISRIAESCCLKAGEIVDILNEEWHGFQCMV